MAKIELERNPLIGPLGKLMDAAFIDRADSAAAVTALAGVEEAARKGLSIVIAPEGTRMDAEAVGPLTVGPFKKGAFRIAMATGLPIVPIVIRNSDSVAGRNSLPARSWHRRYRGAAAHRCRRLDPRGTAEADRAGPDALLRDAGRLARRRSGQQRRTPDGSAGTPS